MCKKKTFHGLLPPPAGLTVRGAVGGQPPRARPGAASGEGVEQRLGLGLAGHGRKADASGLARPRRMQAGSHGLAGCRRAHTASPGVDAGPETSGRGPSDALSHGRPLNFILKI